MKPVKKTVVHFNEDSRREFLTGFHKRKKERKKKAEAQKQKKEKEIRRDLKQKKRAELNERLQEYGLDGEAGESQGGVREEGGGKAATHPHAVCYDHPNHVVIVDTQPNFGPSLSSLAPDSGDDCDSSLEAGNAQKCFKSGVKRLAKVKTPKKAPKRLMKKPAKGPPRGGLRL